MSVLYVSLYVQDLLGDAGLFGAIEWFVGELLLMLTSEMFPVPAEFGPEVRSISFRFTSRIPLRY